MLLAKLISLLWKDDQLTMVTGAVFSFRQTRRVIFADCRSVQQVLPNNKRPLTFWAIVFSYWPFFCFFHHRSAVFASYFLLIKIILVQTKKPNRQRPCSTGKSHKPSEGLNLRHDILKPGNFFLDKKKSSRGNLFLSRWQEKVGQMHWEVSSLSFRLNKERQNFSYILS